MKKLNGKILLSCVFISLLSVHSCRKENGIKLEEDYVFELPFGFPLPNVDPMNPMTYDGIALGRFLYYDSTLSIGGPRSGLACASCHLQSNGFGLPGQNVLPHCNLAWSKNFLWKGEISGTLEDAMLFEVNDFFQVDVDLLRASAFYQQKFRKAFGAYPINDTLVARALAQFVRTLVSSNSEYDRFLRGEISLNPSAAKGMELFFSEKGDCFHCHGNALFTDNAFHNTGLIIKSQADQGRYLVTGASKDMGAFKTPGLRNVGLRSSFMHDGRFKTLKDVIRHYNTGIMKSEFLDPLLDRPPLGLTEAEMDQLASFLMALTDDGFTSETSFSNPF